jgi:methanol metabolism-related c-type cytochrome
VRFPVSRSLLALTMILASGVVVAQAAPPGDPTAVKQDSDGYWRDKNGDPTYKIESDGTVDYATFNGFRRYHADCHVCHGPDGMGSTYAPALAKSLKTMDYATFAGTVVNGRKNLINGNENVMPSFAENKNVSCYLNDIYVYLRARSTDAVPRGRPLKHAPKTAAFGANEDKCMADN